MILFFKRLSVFLFGLTLAWLTIYTIFPLFDHRLPLGVALLATYCLVAYIGLPAILRFWKLLHRPTHVPTRTIASDGWAVDTINLVILANNERDFVLAMRKAGWNLADKPTLKNKLRLVWSIIFNQPYPTAPFGTYFVFGRKQDLGFQIQLGQSPRHRHHVRFWRLGSTLIGDEHEHVGFWRQLLRKFIGSRTQIWVGAAILDKGLSVRMRNLQIDHGIESDTTIERDYLVSTLEKTRVITDKVKIKAGEPLHTSHQGIGETIIADGFVTLCVIKPPKHT